MRKIIPFCYNPFKDLPAVVEVSASICERQGWAQAEHLRIVMRRWHFIGVNNGVDTGTIARTSPSGGGLASATSAPVSHVDDNFTKGIFSLDPAERTASALDTNSYK